MDRESGDPIYSQSELDLATEYIRDYLTKKIQKLSSAQTKTGTLAEDSTFALLSQQAEHDFLPASEKIVNRWYEAYKESEEAPSADVFVVLFEEDTQLYLAFLKVNYHEGYTHLVDSDEAGLKNELILHRALLSSKSQKADEGIVVHLSNLSYEMIEKNILFLVKSACTSPRK